MMMLLLSNFVKSSLSAVLLVLLFAITVDVHAAAQPEDVHLEEARAIFNWISGTSDGYVTPKQDVRRLVPGDMTSPLGAYALKRIEKDEVIVRIPWDTIIKSDDPEEDGQLCCGTVRSVAREMKLGTASKYAPYAQYLNGEPENQIPSSWTKAGQNLFLEVLKNDTDALPPEGPINWLSDDWYGRCGGDPNDEVSKKAALMVVQRSDDSIMIPAYDAYNHRNGNWTNTETNIVFGKYHETTATKTIEAGDEILISYNLCEHCSGRRNGYGTAEILRDYGFVERLPQRWHYMEEDFQFDLDEDEKGHLVLTWNYRPRETDAKLVEQTRAWFRREIRRLRRLKNIDYNFAFEERNHGIARYEWDMIWKFVDANIIAMTVALESLGPSPTEPLTATKADIAREAPEDKKEEEECPEGSPGECPAQDFAELPPLMANGSHYDPLNWEFDDLDYQLPTCNNKRIMQFRDWDDLEFTKTAYQELTFQQKPITDDICMDLDNIVQICSNYRPQYHEYVTHAAARFVKDIRRVIFIGGGDSMLLYEALKYPNLEKVVGLELDQTVTRKSFKHFKTSPYFEDDRVEWWFGDATKSLLLLPQEYWGSFDLVLVDLSETVMSFSVTAELDVFDALSLLLNDVGVMVKNEHYMEKFSQVFDYSLELHYDSPVICSQTLAFGSNNVDFFHDPVYDHGVETLLYGTMHTPETRYDLMHGYRKNIAPKEKCDLKIPEEPTEQRTAAGIDAIVNAENVSVTLDKGITDFLKNTIEKYGFELVADPIFGQDVGFVIFKEGYVVARLWPTDKYVGYDINLWGNTYKIDAIQSDLVKAVGSNNVSSYKVVVGGMYGSNTWKEDQKIIGPKVKQLRHCDEDVVKEGTLDPKKAAAIAIEEIVPLTLTEVNRAAVVCGKKGQECTAQKVLSKHGKVIDVIPIYECPGLGEDVEKAFACETKVLEDLRKALRKSGTKLNLLVLDDTASFEMHQIFNSILSIPALRSELLHGHSISATWIENGETWRREFLDRFCKQVEYDPAARAEIVFQAQGKTYELGVMSTNNTAVNYDYKNLETRLRERLSGSDVKIELRKIHGALWKFQPFFKPRVFRQEDYDSKPGREQFAKQKPLGRQNIFQLVKADNVKEDLSLTMPQIYDYLKQAMNAIRMVPEITRQYYDVGDGGVILVVAPIGNIVLVWDGREHIDINLFTREEYIGLPEKFMGAFLHFSERKMKVGLRDDQPRGIDRVINFPSDMKVSDDDQNITEALKY